MQRAANLIQRGRQQLAGKRNRILAWAQQTLERINDPQADLVPNQQYFMVANYQNPRPGLVTFTKPVEFLGLEGANQFKIKGRPQGANRDNEYIFNLAEYDFFNPGGIQEVPPNISMLNRPAQGGRRKTQRKQRSSKQRSSKQRKRS